MNAYKQFFLCIPIILLVCFGLYSHVYAAETDMQMFVKGIRYYNEGQYLASAQMFQRISEITNSSIREEAIIWHITLLINLRRFEQATVWFQVYEKAYRTSAQYASVLALYVEALYFLKKYELAMTNARNFIAAYSDHPVIDTVYFFAANSMYASGRFAEAHEVFSYIIRSYKHSSYYLAAYSMQQNIAARDDSKELLQLLRVSHENNISNSQELFQARSTNVSLQTQLKVYNGIERDITKLKRENQELNTVILDLQNRIQQIEEQLGITPTTEMDLVQDSLLKQSPLEKLDNLSDISTQENSIINENQTAPVQPPEPENIAPVSNDEKDDSIDTTQVQSDDMIGSILDFDSITQKRLTEYEVVRNTHYTLQKHVYALEKYVTQLQNRIALS